MTILHHCMFWIAPSATEQEVRQRDVTEASQKRRRQKAGALPPARLTLDSRPSYVSLAHQKIQTAHKVCQIRPAQILGSCAWQEESKGPECPAYMNLIAS